MVILNSVEAAVDLMEKRSSNYSDRAPLPAFTRMGWSKALATMRYGQEFRMHRRILQQHFNKAKIRNYESIQLLEARTFARNLLTDPEEKKNIINRFTTSIITHITYGHRVTSDEDPYVILVEDIGRGNAETGNASGALLDFQFLEYLPSWFPGTYYVNHARKWAPKVKEFHDLPFEREEGRAKACLVTSELQAFEDKDANSTKTISDIKGAAGQTYIGGAETHFIWAWARVVYATPSTMSSYPPIPPFTWDSIVPRDLLAVFPPPDSLLHPPPSLPSPPRKPIFDAPYTLSTHIFPAAHLRTTDYVPVPPTPPPDAPKAERQAVAEQTAHTLKALRTSLTPRGSPQVLWNCANRYVRNGLDGTQARGLTLFFAHANGFMKEIWEPVLQHLLASPAASIIDEVWTWESVQHGDAFLINGDKIGGVFDWTDNARDILNFLTYYLPSTASAAALPTHLPRLPPAESEHRKTNPFRHRTFIAVGHSYGGCTSYVLFVDRDRDV
ncbi:hypothetical protein H0H81_002773 [Sphagnurus paluster]|uniref:Uncharacterized protein n=1 Tax=Sphagnurus paluster TaxID=117069 RepID=A0A9P7K5M5_9AGAR|nr:hypothetical protein H0H81_002773 [Sphagnurus paluster]